MERFFAQVPDDLITDPNLGHLAVRVWCRLDKYAGRDGDAFPARRTLAADLSVSVGGIKRALNELTAAGWITRSPRPSGASWITVLHNRPRVSKRPDPGSNMGRPRITDEPTSAHGRATEGHPPKDTHVSENHEEEKIVKSAAPTTAASPPRQSRAPQRQEEEARNETEMAKVIRDALPAGMSQGISKTTMARLTAGLIKRGWGQGQLHLGIREHDWDYANGSGAAVSWLQDCDPPKAKRGCPDCKGIGFTNYGGYGEIGVCDCADETLLSVPGIDYQDA